MSPRPAAVALALLLAPLPAAAQFGIFGSSRSDDAPVPPGSIPGGAPSQGGAQAQSLRAPSPQGTTSQGGPSQPGEAAPAGGASGPPPPPPPPKPVVLRAPTEEGVLNQELKLNGRDGSLRLERVGSPEPAAPARSGRARPPAPPEGSPPATGASAAPAGPSLRLRLLVAGSRISQPTESCTVKVDGAEALPLESQGKPDGAPRFELKGASCPVSFDVLEGAVWVRGPAESCAFEAQDCRADPKGLWGPEPGALFAQAKTIEAARGLADRAVRENYKLMTSRAKPQEVRPIVQEQAAFSSERETLCRGYAREAAHGFCNTRFTEGRAVALATRLGATTPTVLATEDATPPRPRPPRPRPSVAAAPPEAPPPQAPRPSFWPFFR